MTGTGRTLISGASGSGSAATLSVTGSSDKALHSGRILQNAGETTFSGAYINTGNGAVIENSGTLDIKGDGDINNVFGGTRTRLENTGTLKKTSGTASTDIGATVRNTGGTIDVASGTLNLGGGLDNFSSTAGVGKLTGGTYTIRTNSILKFTGADIDVNAATIVLDGLGSAILDQNNSDAIDNLSDNDGSFTIKSDRDLRTHGTLRNDGSVTIGTGSVLTTTGEYVQAAGSTVLEDTTSKLAASGARVRVQNGVIKGLGTVEPALEATGGRVQPGISSGILKVAGSYAPGSNGTLEVEIGGVTPGSGHDQLDVGTTASLGGTLDIVTPSSFTPTPGQTFTILKCGAVTCRSGQFDAVQGTDLGSGLEYQVRYNATDVTLALDNPPVAEDQSVTTAEDVAKEVTLRASDVENDSLTYDVVSGPAHGSLSGTGANLTYTPHPDFFGDDSFTFKANDGNADSNVATVRITVDPVNDAPVATDDSAETDEDTAKDIIVLGNDEDVEGDSLSVSSVGSANHGTVTKNDDNTIKYVPEADYNGPDEFTYTVSDGNGGTDTATVSITLRPVNDAPVAKDDTAETDEDTPTNIDVIANDEDEDNTNAELSIASFTQPANGQVSLDNGKLRYEPALNYNGSDIFTYKAKDASNADSDGATVSIDVKAVNDKPVAVDDNDTTDEDTALSVDVVANDTDVDNSKAQLSVSSLTQPSHGAVSLDNGKLRYEPALNFNGPDSFTYKVSDGSVESDSAATVTIDVKAVNDAPVAVDDSLTTDEDTAGKGNVLTNDTDVDNVNLTAAQVSGPAHGTLTLNNDGSFEYKPETDYSGPDSFTYKASDGQADSDVVTVSIKVNAVNDAPVAEDDSAETAEDTPIDINVLANDEDVDNTIAELSIASFTQPANGQVSDNGNGTLKFEPAPNYNGTDEFTYTVSDENGGTDTATVNINVTAVNDAPVAANDEETTPEDTPVLIDVLANDTEVDGDSLTITSVSNPAHGTAAAENGKVRYTPAENYHGSEEFTYEVSDGNGETATARVSITVESVNDAPVADDQPVTIHRDTTTNITLGGSDVDGDSLHYNVVNGPQHGTLGGSGANLTYTPHNNYDGPDSFTFKANDGTADSNLATVSITVKSGNDAPIVNNLQGADAANEGETRAYTFQITDPDSSTFSFATGSPTCGGTGKGEVVGTPVINNDRSGSFECRFLDGGVPPTQVSVSVQVKDESQASGDVASKNVGVSNVAPKIDSLSGPAQVLTNQPVAFTGTHSDPAGTLDNPFTWQWSGGTSTDTDENNSYLTKFSACGPQNVKATVTDKDGGTSAEATQSTPVRAYNGNFLPPLQTGKDNLVQKGQVVPVKISVTGCDGINLAGLSPYLQLFSGDPTAAINEADFIVPVASVSADTGQTMRPVPDGYIYNLRVPSDAQAKAGAKYYIRVSPFGLASSQHMIISIQIRK